MAIIFSEDLTRDQGKLANADIIQGSWRTVGSKSDLNALTGSVSDKQRIEDGQLFWAKDEDTFYRYKVVQVGFSQTLTFEEFSFGGGSTPDGTISGSQQISDLGFLSSADTGSFVLISDTGSFLLVSQTGSFLTTSSFNDATSSFTLLSDFNDITSSLSTFVVYSASNATTASYIDPTFISASAAASGFGAGGGSEVGGIFIQTGSYYATTNDLQITGSVTIGDGLLKFKEYDSLPSVEGGTIAYYDGVFWLGQDN
jgi:hypothetical protein